MRNGEALSTVDVHNAYRQWSADYFGIPHDNPALCSDVALVHQMALNGRAARLIAEMLHVLRKIDV